MKSLWQQPTEGVDVPLAISDGSEPEVHPHVALRDVKTGQVVLRAYSRRDLERWVDDQKPGVVLTLFGRIIQRPARAVRVLELVDGHATDSHPQPKLAKAIVDDGRRTKA